MLTVQKQKHVFVGENVVGKTPAAFQKNNFVQLYSLLLSSKYKNLWKKIKQFNPQIMPLGINQVSVFNDAASFSPHNEAGVSH